MKKLKNGEYQKFLIEEMDGTDKLFINKNKSENQLTKIDKTTILKKLKKYLERYLI